MVSAIYIHTLNTQISTDKRLLHINVLYAHFDIVDLFVGLLGADELAAGAKEGGRVIRSQLSSTSAFAHRITSLGSLLVSYPRAWESRACEGGLIGDVTQMVRDGYW